MKQNIVHKNEIRQAEAATYKVPEAAKVARVGTEAIRRGVREGRIPHILFGRNILIPKHAFLRWLDSCGDHRREA